VRVVDTRKSELCVRASEQDDDGKDAEQNKRDQSGTQCRRHLCARIGMWGVPFRRG
jgi:hypothetical protein